ncbi:hypothetical protein [Bradyrhizobium jicamae]|uniref:hypothetical protein n=1 Tax=Bradyrhizobium jicamae TaxID=280332 RepID=UPI001BA8E15A|nr:hypothetical protein [Bradyrhizobium jicamae]MBR0939024.1 hypothetical protein [Bradyrhizobium jicamae]
MRRLPAVKSRRVALASLQEIAGSLSEKYAPGKAVRTRVPEPGGNVGRKLNFSSALLSFSVLADSGLEHYRGSFQNRLMYLPLAVSAATLAASLFGIVDGRAKSHVVRDGLYGLAALTGATGLGFHGYNIVKRPGHLSWINLFYAAPVGAPVALLLAGVLGRVAERVRDDEASTLLGYPAGEVLGAVTSAGLAGTVAEAGLLHFRGAFQNPGMFLPVVVPPAAAGLLAMTLFRSGNVVRRAAKLGLGLTALLGFVGVGFHAYGVSRNMGGWRNWSQNILNGPPLPAPPSFTGLALAGLAALSLVERNKKAGFHD